MICIRGRCIVDGMCYQGRVSPLPLKLDFCWVGGYQEPSITWYPIQFIPACNRSPLLSGRFPHTIHFDIHSLALLV